MNLSREHLDALNVTLNWFGGSMNRLDASVASIDSSVMADLVDLGLVRKRHFGWNYQITYIGRQALQDAGITKFSNTRVW
jgi:hypothetical protein